MDIIFDIIDKTGRKIRLTRKQYSHICKKHPMISNYFEELKETLVKPDKVIESNDDISVRFYYKFYKKLEPPYQNILVIVKYLNGRGFIISAYFVKNIL
ncbi:MAG: PBECR2 nuclease fold domain-containing protein [Nanoarchaeota archaeon]|nr:PBECR2 nuclease fold domain-containing protein [Nanoarchaeota archaeon]